MDLVLTHGMMANNMQAGGKTENNMEKEPIAKMAVIEKVSGKTEKELDGLMTPNGSKTIVNNKWITSVKQLVTNEMKCVIDSYLD